MGQELDYEWLAECPHFIIDPVRAIVLTVLPWRINPILIERLIPEGISALIL